MKLVVLLLVTEQKLLTQIHLKVNGLREQFMICQEDKMQYQIGVTYLLQIKKSLLIMQLDAAWALIGIGE